MEMIGLSDLVGFLDSLKPSDFTANRMDYYLKNHRLDAASLGSFCCFRSECYGRNLISKNDAYELLILTWMPGQRTPIHDHFGQKCWMLVHSGQLTLKNYAVPESPTDPLVPLESAFLCAAGNCCYVDDKIAVHSIANASQEPAVSIHLYAGPVPECQIYDEVTKRFVRKVLCYTNDFSNLFPPTAHPEAPILRS